ncbi:MAG: hypothetical protein JW939_01060 [Candidatus Thermoplasmatota archaeon]|nr:hypothetical protein [Candidatus Thermoplasmatota archaeon]
MAKDTKATHSDRMEALYLRIGKLEEKVADTKRAREIFKDLEQVISRVNDEQKVDEAFEKFEQILKKLEEKTIKAEMGATRVVKDETPSDQEKIKESITGINGKFRVLMNDFKRAGELERIREIEERFSECLKRQKDADPEGMKNVLSSLKDIQNEAENLHKVLTEDLTMKTNRSLSKVEEMINEISSELDTTSLREELGEVRRFLFDGDLIDAWEKSRDLASRVGSESNVAEFRKLEALLLSVAPLMGKIEASEGTGSKLYLDLKKKQDSIIEMAREDPKEALAAMKTFLDRVASEATEIEEKPVKEIQKKISELRSTAEDIVKLIDPSAVLNILERADGLVMDGAMDEAYILVNGAESELSRLKEEKAFEFATLRMEEIKRSMAVMHKKGLDITPLKGPVNEALRSLKDHNMQLLEKIMTVIDQRLVYISNEEIKIEYQKNLTKIMDKMKELTEGGQDVKDLENELDEMRSFYLDRKYEKAVRASERLLDKIDPRLLYRTVDKRKQIVEEMIMEADALEVDVSSSREKLSRANELVKAKEPEKAVDLYIEAQVELEDRMTRRMFSSLEIEIRDLASQCKEHGSEMGDVNEKISAAYSLADEGRIRDALEDLTGFRESLARKASAFKAQDLIIQMSDLIKQGRQIGMEVSQYKAILTKSRVLREVGDVNGANELLSRVTEKLLKKISERMILQDKMDKLGGNLLAQKGKIARLERSGVTVDGFKQRISNITALIDSLDAPNAEKALTEMDHEVNALLMASPEQLKKEMVSTIMEDQYRGPDARDGMTSLNSLRRGAFSEDEQARTELFTLIPKIKVEITRMHSKGMETEEYKKDIEKIQDLVIQKQYIKALEIGKDCYSRMTSIS